MYDGAFLFIYKYCDLASSFYFNLYKKSEKLLMLAINMNLIQFQFLLLLL